MVDFDPDSLATGTGGSWTRSPVAPITGFDMDTRTIRPGQAFVALRTDKRDGHDFLTDAEAAGAAAAIVSKARHGAKLPQLVVADPLSAFQIIARNHRRRFKGPVIGITGSAGKTSTKDLLTALLGGEPSVLATRHNLNNHIGVPLTLTQLDPEAHLFAVVEAGTSAPGEMGLLAAMIEPDVAIVTLVAPAHLDKLKGMEAVAMEKSALAAAVRPGGIAIFPASCAEFPAFEKLRGAKMIIESSSLSHLPIAKGRILFSFEHRGERTTVTLGGAPGQRFELPRVSDGMAQNAALALCAAMRLHVEPDLLRSRLGGWRPVSLRGEWRRDGDRMLYLDCYNASPASMTDALAAFCATAPEAQPRLFVLGGMEELGVESERYHRALGRSVRLRPSDFLVAIGTHAGAVLAGALEAGNRSDQMEATRSPEPAAARLAEFRGAVFIKGSRKYALERLAGEVAHA